MPGRAVSPSRPQAEPPNQPYPRRASARAPGRGGGYTPPCARMGPLAGGLSFDQKHFPKHLTAPVYVYRLVIA
jgi:hypothetical protein